MGNRTVAGAPFRRTAVGSRGGGKQDEASKAEKLAFGPWVRLLIGDLLKARDSLHYYLLDYLPTGLALPIALPVG